MDSTRRPGPLSAVGRPSKFVRSGRLLGDELPPPAAGPSSLRRSHAVGREVGRQAIDTLHVLQSPILPKIVDAMTSVGNNLGIAFQVADDVLDLTGSECDTGKSLGTDVLQKKLTLPLIHLLQQGDARSEEAREILEAPTERRLPRLRQLLVESRSIQYAQQEAERYVRQARELLLLLPSSEARQTLDSMMLKIIHRKS